MNQAQAPAEASSKNEYAPKTPFEFPPSLSSKHREELEKRAISPEFALQSGVRTAADNELRKLNFQASLPVVERDKGLQGICFPYRDIEANEEMTWRIKPDTPFLMGDGKPAKYLSRIGDKPRAFFPHTTTPQLLKETRYNLIITEGEYKTLAIAQAVGIAEPSRKFAVIGLQGVNGGWGREKANVPTADGGHEKKPIGMPHLIEDLQNIEWRKRRVYIVFDSDVGGKAHAAAFKKSKHAGAWGAEHALAELLRAQGADVRIVEIPDDGAEKVGADDYIVKHGPYEFVRLLWNNWVSNRDVEKVLHQAQAEALVFVEAHELVRLQPARPVFIIDKLLPEGGTCMIAAAPKVGKSGIALNAAKAVATGELFLNHFPVRKGRAVYIQTEIPTWAMSERLKLMGELPDGMLIHSPGRMKLNLWEEDGYQKRRETGNRERVAALIEALRQQAASLVIFDPLRHFHSLNELSVDHVAHLFEVFRGIARAVPCGVIIVHHHRKIGRSQVTYEGAEDMSGSGALFGEADSIISIYAKVRADDTRRYKMIFDLRHAETPAPLELSRMSGENAMLWDAEEWRDDAQTVISDRRSSIEDYLEEHPTGVDYKQACDDLRIPQGTWYRSIKALQNSGKVRKIGNLFFIGDKKRENGYHAED